MLEVKFNIARAYYEDGEYTKAAELFKEFALDHPDHKDAPVAGNLALDSLRQINDFKGSRRPARLPRRANLPAAFQADVQKILTQSKGEALGELALKSSEETGDVVNGLLKVADENKGAGDRREGALRRLHRGAREARRAQGAGDRRAADQGVREVASYISDVMLTLGRHAAEAGRFEDAAAYFEQMGRKFAGDSTGLDIDALLGAAAHRDGRLPGRGEGVRDRPSSRPGRARPRCWCSIAETHMKMKEPAKARAIAEQALKVDKHERRGGGDRRRGGRRPTPNEKLEPLVAMMTAITNGPNGAGDDAAKGLWYLGDMLYRAVQGDPRREGRGEGRRAAADAGRLPAGGLRWASAEWAVASLWRIGNGFAAHRRRGGGHPGARRA